MKKYMVEDGWGAKMPAPDSEEADESDDDSNLDPNNDTGAEAAPNTKKTHLLHPHWGITIANEGMSAGMHGLLEPFALMIE